jgi:signal transduction histidine kinase
MSAKTVENNLKVIKISHYWKTKVVLPVYLLIFISSFVTLFLTSYLIDLNHENKIQSLSKVLLSSITPSLEVGDTLTVQEDLSNFAINTNTEVAIISNNRIVIISSEKFENTQQSDYTERSYPIKFQEQENNSSLILRSPRESSTKLILFFVLLISPVILIFLSLFVLRKFKHLIDDVTSSFQDKTKKSSFKEIQDVQTLITDQSKAISENQALLIKKQAYIQVAHDIRSPLEALKSTQKNFSNLDGRTRNIIESSIKRISEIANSLLNYNNSDFTAQPVNLKLLLEEISSAYTNNQVKINLLSESQKYNDYNILSSESKLYRVLTNLINNAIESQTEKDLPIVDISISKSSNSIIVSIKDYGKGMDDDFLIKALDGGISSKIDGNGLGLSYAKKTIELLGGSFSINTNKNTGTLIEIELIKSSSPICLVESLRVSKKNIICIDDDESFLELYKEKFHLFQVSIFNNTIDISDEELRNSHFFIDYDLSASETGLDFILKNKLSKSATLVTSMHRNENVLEICKQNNIEILPKEMFNSAEVIYKLNTVTNAVLIDDDELIHILWEQEARLADVNLSCYKSIEIFIQNFAQHPYETTIYVDSNLSNEIKGEIESKKIYELGFKKIILATGYSKGDIKKPSWIEAIIGKRPHFQSTEI